MLDKVQFMQLDKYKILMLLIGTGMYLDLFTVARVPIGECIAFMAIPFVLFYNYKAIDFKRFRLVSFFLLIWGIGVVVSDLINGTGFTWFVKGIAKPVYVFSWMTFFACSIRRSPDSISWFTAGLCLASVQNYFFPSIYHAGLIESGGYMAIATGISPIIETTTIFLGLTLFKYNKFATILLFMASVAILLVAGAPRSQSGIHFLSGLMLLYAILRQRSGLKAWLPNKLHYLLLIFGLIIISFIFYEIYAIVAGSGALGEEQAAKQAVQAQNIFGNNLFGVLMVGRAEVLASILAIIESPIIGYGSWAGIQLQSFYVEAIGLVGTDSSNYNLITRYGTSGGAGHSIFFGLWVDHGILVAISLIFLAIIAVKEYFIILSSNNKDLPFFVFMGINFAWAFLFSPFAVFDRIIIGLFIAMYVSHFSHAQTANHKSQLLFGTPDVQSRLKHRHSSI